MKPALSAVATFPGSKRPSLSLSRKGLMCDVLCSKTFLLLLSFHVLRLETLMDVVPLGSLHQRAPIRRSRRMRHKSQRWNYKDSLLLWPWAFWSFGSEMQKYNFSKSVFFHGDTL